MKFKTFLKKTQLVLENAFATIFGLSICCAITIATVGGCIWLFQWVLRLLGVM